jgi:hypothetical protein
MRSELYRTYENAARDYLTKLNALMQPPRQPTGNAMGVFEWPAEAFIRGAEEIVDISSGLLQLAQEYLISADPISREGIQSHFIDQATVELLLGIELLRISEEKNAVSSTAAICTTHSAALREAISAVERSSAAPVARGLPMTTSCRASDSATIDEAVSGLRLAVESTASSISRRVQDLGNDIAHDLVAGMQWTEVIEGASLSVEQISTIMESIQEAGAGKILLHVYRKMLALVGMEVAADAQIRIRDWLDQIRKADRIDVFAKLVDNLYKGEVLKKAINGIECSASSLDSLNKATDLIKALSDKFIFLIGRMRKLEDAIRLGKSITTPQFRLVTIALHVTLLSALVHTGRDYIENGLRGILRGTGFG